MGEREGLGGEQDRANEREIKNRVEGQREKERERERER